MCLECFTESGNWALRACASSSAHLLSAGPSELWSQAIMEEGSNTRCPVLVPVPVSGSQQHGCSPPCRESITQAPFCPAALISMRTLLILCVQLWEGNEAGKITSAY